jgi:hypothetical protein
MVASQAQGSGGDATAIVFGLDPDQDRVLTEATTTSAGTKTLTNHYDDASDETAWTSTVKADGTMVTKRYVDGIDGDLSATVADDGTVKLDLTNLHGTRSPPRLRPQRQDDPADGRHEPTANQEGKEEVDEGETLRLAQRAQGLAGVSADPGPLFGAEEAQEGK